MQALPTEPNSDSEHATDASGSFKNYQLKQCLGEGGFGQVFEAWDCKLLRPVAIKRLKSGVSESISSNLLREARLAASLSHPAFVKIHALEEFDDQTQAIVMELVRGMTLKQLLITSPPDQARALGIVCQIAQAMQEAHLAGLTHGDLKPSNIMVEPQGQVRILDFGLAAQSDFDVTTSLMQADPQGTIAYMAPERLQGASLKPQSDIYALGVMLFEMLAGARPFSHLNGLALAAAQVQSSSDQWPYPANMPPKLGQLIRDMTARLPEQRLQSMAQVVAQLMPALSQAGVSIPVPLNLAPMQIDATVSSPVINNVAVSRVGRRMQMAFGVVAVCALLGLGVWKFAAQSVELPVWATPFSEAREMQQGLVALRLFDRPGSLESATKSFGRILEHNPKNAAAVAGMSLVYSYRYKSDRRDENWLQKADVAAQQAMMLNDQLALCHIAKAYVLLHQGKWESALNVSERALALEPMNIFAWIAKIGALRSLRRVDQVREFIELAIQRFPGERMFFDELGHMFLDQSNFKEAEQAFRQSIAVQPDAVYSYTSLAAVLMRLNRQDEALQVLQQGLQIRPTAMLYGNLGNIMFIRGDYLAAVRAFEHAVSPDKGNPDDYLGWANLADTLLWIPGREVEAKRAYEKARQLLAPMLARRKNDITLVSRMGLYAARTGNHVEAKALMVQAVSLAPTSPDVRFRAGLAYELLGDRKTALTEITKAKSLGYPGKFIEAEPDLVALRRDPAYLNH